MKYDAFHILTINVISRDVLSQLATNLVGEKTKLGVLFDFLSMKPHYEIAYDPESLGLLVRCVPGSFDKVAKSLVEVLRHYGYQHATRDALTRPTQACLTYSVGGQVPAQLYRQLYSEYLDSTAFKRRASDNDIPVW